MMPEKATEAFSAMVLYGCQPVLVFMSFQKEKYNAQIGLNMLIVAGISIVAHIAMALIISLIIRNKTKETVMSRYGVENVFQSEDVKNKSNETHIKDYGYFDIGGACYPEIHPESANQKEDIFYLKEKVEAGCEFLTTQMFFDNNLLYNFLYKIREAGITVPIIPGIMPITNGNQVDRAIKLSGSFMPQRFKSLVDKFGTTPAAMKQAGIAYATDQIIDLFANGITNVHVYSMNKPDVAEAIQCNLSDILG